MRTIAIAFAVLVALAPALTQAQQLPYTLPPNTVVGRSGNGTGPAQAIPFTILTNNLLGSLNTISGDCTVTTAGVITCTKINGLPITGIDFNTLNTQLTTYSIATTDCSKTVQAGTGTTGQFTITLPAAGGFASNCAVTITNGDAVRGKILSGFPSGTTTTLYPGQTIKVEVINGAWVATVKPGRWKLPGTTQFFLDNINGSDSNDCLAAGAGAACATMAHLVNIMAQDVDFNGQFFVPQFAGSQTWNTQFNLNQSWVGGGQLLIDGGSSTFNATSGSTFNFNTTMAGPITLRNMSIGSTSAGSYAVSVSAPNEVNLNTGITFIAASTSGGHVLCSGTGSALAFISNYTISGGGGVHVNAVQNGLCILSSVVGTVTTNVTFNGEFVNASKNGTVDATGSSWSIGGNTVTATRFLGATNGTINTGQTGMNFFPGTAAGQLKSGAVYDGLTAPGVSSCGGTPGSASGTDFAGSVTEGTTATGCTITFTSATTMASCAVNLSTNNAVGISTLGATLVVTHASLSGNVLYWNCRKQGE